MNFPRSVALSDSSCCAMRQFTGARAILFDAIRNPGVLVPHGESTVAESSSASKLASASGRAGCTGRCVFNTGRETICSSSSAGNGRSQFGHWPHTGLVDPFDGIAELWVESLEAIEGDWSTHCKPTQPAPLVQSQKRDHTSAFCGRLNC